MVLQDDGYLCYNIIAENTYLSSNNITEIRHSVLSSLHIGGAKYRIYSSKTETDTKITILKMTERIYSNTILEVTDS